MKIRTIKQISLMILIGLNFSAMAESISPTVSNLSIAPSFRQSEVILVPTNSWSSPFTIPSSPISSPAAAVSEGIAVSVGEVSPASLSLSPNPSLSSIILSTSSIVPSASSIVPSASSIVPSLSIPVSSLALPVSSAIPVLPSFSLLPSSALPFVNFNQLIKDTKLFINNTMNNNE